ncbi:tRNA preQ1(34) S-adenosylmethionine ribosyltransferase-isomerase QueA [Acidipila sp. EB88]|uniref:tRNA preQ1(34) S-adenosylmethionine ribosyltransferase-isomerase QueA n=1 Tax=Acidipila sp. EB88 TaxID=2305226 RepID=UPI000F5F8251|nr:tRNA preQ1(34) S-adenosylmethionine ribosyltransferase-isomerase QueA [Acidipila sp. EB88]RRA50112.1 tRNA preQ1(34) S-adenosylmethionine ribosyltransferase-isomerase QueA [Acidipila sp. EB88]
MRLDTEQPALVSDYDFALPPELIAQAPPAERSGARMLTLDRMTGSVADRQFTDLPQQLAPGDLLVLNNSRVLPARLFGRRLKGHAQSGQQPARIEVLLIAEQGPGEWTALVRPGRKVLRGERLVFPFEGAPVLEAEVLEHGEFGERVLRFAVSPGAGSDFYAALDTLGQMPLPPYIHREQSVTTAADRERYQTVYAAERGSVAAPTAGLHFTPEVLEQIRARGVEIVYVTLHVGLGTFQPVRVDRLDAIKLHSERYTLPAPTAQAINRTKQDGRRVVAAGTTTVRTLEHCARVADGAPLAAHAGATDIFLSPGHRFQIVDALLTNFHLPASTLLMLVCAFAGRKPVLAAYRHAVAERYRFFSYGDCMFLS